jgi:hypothetical protein
MGRLRIRRGLTFAAALLAGGALALPFAAPASSSSPAATSTGTTGTGTTGTGTTGTGTTGTTTTSTTTTTTPTTTTGTTGTTTTTTTPKPRPPLAYSGSVAQITYDSAQLKAAIDPEGLATTYHFQYGPTAAYGSQTPSAAAGSGAREVTVTRAIAGLEPSTTYHFRVVASNSAGTTDSAPATFTTGRIPWTLAASVTPSPVAFGRPLSLTGTLSGPGDAGVEVVVQENPFPYDRGFSDISSPEPTDAAGNFSLPLAGLFESSQLRVATAGKPTVYSPPIGDLVMVRVTLHARRAERRGYVRLYGTITPSEPGAKVAFERLRHGRYATVSGTTVSGPAGASSRFARTVRLRRGGRYRAFVQIAGGALVSGRSRPIAIR